ncbi:hypothetical protein VT84_37530 [Gemmata sp. SH-PL17]|uniref:hypothetical protein n=1 Tax=Gemmata sp. SH-PL17 TaxID=1630693 RepID=UPI00078E3E43|nr:hypothetical protein [Gemmata sp. SH-PL17]AMV30155.1 hypothetical protein VT84_37530 [Gemmata sp. SH-PL17]
MVALMHSDEFRAGRAVRLLVVFLAWPGDPGSAVTPNQRAQALSAQVARGTWLSPRESFTFVCRRWDRPGGSVVRDERGHFWNVPDDYLTSHPIDDRPEARS